MSILTVFIKPIFGPQKRGGPGPPLKSGQKQRKSQKREKADFSLSETIGKKPKKGVLGHLQVKKTKKCQKPRFLPFLGPKSAFFVLK